MTQKAIQDFYPDEVAICYGCGRHNDKGMHIKTYWDGQEGFSRFRPQPHHTAFPGVVYGGLIASLIDCHSIGTAIAAAYQAEGRDPGTEPGITCVTGNLNVTYLQPTPMGVELVLRSQIREQKDRKTIVSCSVYADDKKCAQGEVTAIRVPSRLNLDRTQSG